MLKTLFKSKLTRYARLLAFVSCLLLSAARLNAQETAAYKVDEVVDPGCDFSEVPQITDLLPKARILSALDEHKNAGAAIIVYGQHPGTVLRYAREVRRWMYDARGVDPEQLVALYGGRSDQSMRLELWLVPPGAEGPQTRQRNLISGR